jgi:hypothetical protein
MTDAIAPTAVTNLVRPALVTDGSSRVEVSHVKRRLLQATEAARGRAKSRREHNAAAEQDYAVFLAQIAVPVTRQVANVLRAEGQPFTTFTPGSGPRLAYDKGRDDFIEIGLDTDGDAPVVVGRRSHTRGSRTVVDVQPIGAGARPADLTDEDVLEYLATALEPWLER